MAQKKVLQPKLDATSAAAKNAESAVELRKRISRLDHEIMEAVNKRAAWSQQLSSLRRGDTNLTSGSEDVIGVDQVIAVNEGPLSSVCIRSVFREITSGCRALSRTTRVGFLGPLSSYSHEAAIERFGNCSEFVPLGTIAAVFEEVASGDIDFGLVPLENSTDGRIADTLHMFTRIRVRITGEVNLRIHHQLVGQGPRSRVQKICSKPQALSQCRGWLSEHFPAVELVETASTTVAAELAAKDATFAAIASRHAAANYGLDILAADIEDRKNNVTRFAVLGEKSGEKTAQDKTAVVFQVTHEPGALADVLTIFKRNHLNLTWIESFPLPERNNEYFFFAEFQGHEKELRVRRALTALEKKTHLLDVLGSYAATKILD